MEKAIEELLYEINEQKNCLPKIISEGKIIEKLNDDILSELKIIRQVFIDEMLEHEKRLKLHFEGLLSEQKHHREDSKKGKAKHK